MMSSDRGEEGVLFDRGCVRACVRGVFLGGVWWWCNWEEGGVEHQFSWGRCWGGWLLESRGQWLAGVRELGRRVREV